MNTVIDYFFNHHDRLLYLLSAIAFFVELNLINLGSPMLFFAIGSLITGTFVSFNMINTWEMELLFMGIFTLASNVLFWKPLKKSQHNNRDSNSEMIGNIVAVNAVLTKQGGSIDFSGISCKARLCADSLHDKIAVGEYVEIHAFDGNVMLIK